MGSKDMKKKITNEGWGVFNTELGIPCRSVNRVPPNDVEEGIPLFTSDVAGLAKKMALEWRKRTRLDKFKEIKVLKCSITYEI